MSPVISKETFNEVPVDSFDCNGIVLQDTHEVSLVEDSPVAIKEGTVENSVIDRHTLSNDSSLIAKTSKRSTSAEREKVKGAKLVAMKYSDKGFTASLSSASSKEAMIPGQRIIFWKRICSSEAGYGEWVTYRLEDAIDDSLQFVMSRGGLIEFFPALVDNVVDFQNEMQDVKEFRQYSVPGLFQ